jgi:hypothetical protein
MKDEGMSLQDLVAGHRATHEPVGSGLTGLLRPAVAAVPPAAATRMSLPAAMRALEAGLIARPPDGDLNGMVIDTELPLKPASAPKQSIGEFDRKGMAERLATRRRALEATFMPDQRKWARLAGYEEYLMEHSNG